MTVLPRRSGGLVALVAAIVLAGCGSTQPTPPAATEAPPATVAPTPGEAGPPTAAPTASAAASPAASGGAAEACAGLGAGGATASAAPDTGDPNAATYTEIEGQVAELRGITPTTTVERGVFDQAGLCAYLAEGFAKHNPEDLTRATETFYKALGLVLQDANVEDLYLEMLTSQVAGLYDEESKHMYVVTSAGGGTKITPFEEATYAHEFTHALQDQRFGLKALEGEAKDQSDATLAKVALVEGDATLLMYLWMQRYLTPQEQAQIASSIDPSSQAILDRMPPILKDPLEFPYFTGIGVAMNAFTAGGYGAVDALYAEPPASTEQVLHPEKLASREAPVKLTFPDDLAARLGDGWTVPMQDTLGELLLGVILRDAEGVEGASDAAAGWGGDRAALIQGPDGETAVVLDTAWDTPADADEFAAALEPTVTELKGLGRSPSILRPAPDRVVLVTAETADTMAKVANVLGLAG